MDKSIENLWSVLFTTGYLTQQGRTQNGKYLLSIPNTEIRNLFTKENKWKSLVTGAICLAAVVGAVLVLPSLADEMTGESQTETVSEEELEPTMTPDVTVEPVVTEEPEEKQDSEETESAEETTKPEEEKKDEEKATDEPQATEEPQYQSAAKQDESDNLRQHNEVGRIDSHDFHGVDLFGDTHGADLRRNIAADLTGQDQTHHGGREFQNQNLAGGQSCGVCGNQRRYDIDGHLNAYHGTDEYGNDDDQGNCLLYTSDAADD
mgnify:CR=1 FL=1